jgi:hypothetical protein
MLRRRIDPHSNFSLFIFSFSFASSAEEESKCESDKFVPGSQAPPKDHGRGGGSGMVAKGIAWLQRPARKTRVGRFLLALKE